MTEKILLDLSQEDYLDIYLQRKILKHKCNIDNKPYTKREIRLIKFAFKAGWNTLKYEIRKGVKL